MPEIALTILAIGIGGGALTLARRFRNSESNAGEGIAGWSMFLIIACVCEHFCSGFLKFILKVPLQ